MGWFNMKRTHPYKGTRAEVQLSKPQTFFAREAHIWRINPLLLARTLYDLFIGQLDRLVDLNADATGVGIVNQQRPYIHAASGFWSFICVVLCH